MPLIVKPANSPELLFENASLEIVGRRCKLKKYNKLKNISSFDISGEFIAYASPDSTYAVTRQMIDQAKKEIIIGIYDFTAKYMKDLILNAMNRGVKVSLMLDIDSPAENEIFKDLAKFGCTTVEAPSCASKIVSYFPSSHEKVIVIDGTWSLVQSGNYSNNSIPFNEKDGGDPKHFVKGNRDMGVAINSKPLADFFKKLLKRDMKLELDAERLEAVAGEKTLDQLPALVEAVPKLIPVKLFPSKSFKPTKKVSVTPVLTPDNYMDTVIDLLESATKSIYIENQYIRSTQAEVSRLLEAIKTAKTNKPGLDVRIVLGKLFGPKDFDKEVINIANIKEKFQLVLSKNIRYIDTKRFVHCHNKIIIVDEKRVLVSSQNWSDTGVGTNREAGILMEFPEIAKYYSQIFESDWSTALTKIPKPAKATVTPEAVRKGNFVEVVAADYQEV